jgi:hypothetical protein
VEQKLVKIFTEALLNNDLVTIKAMLHPEGEFNFQTPKLNTRDAKARKFLNWLKKRLDSYSMEELSKMDYYLDNCMFCKIGNPVVIIDEGKFPRIPKDDSEQEKTGLMFEVKDEKIHSISFCYTFLKTSNKFIFEKKYKMAKDYMAKSGCDFITALNWVKKQWPNHHK